MLHMFHTNIYTDFRKPYKNSYVIWVNQQNQNVTKLNIIGCLDGADQDQHLKLSPQNHILFFDKKQSKPPGKYLWT